MNMFPLTDAGTMRIPFPLATVRDCFPALKKEDFVFFDNAAGAQIPQLVLDAVTRHLIENNVQRGGRYPKTVAVDATIARARESAAILINAEDASEIAFGMNATSFIRLISLAIGQTLNQRNEIIVTDMDHEANVATWLALEKNGAKFAWWRMRDDGNLHAEDLEKLLSPRTRLVACTVTSNALGSVVDVKAAGKLAHTVGAEIFLDCVHYGPHGPIDVQAWDCDYLVCSGYKIFAPHMGFLWGRRALLKSLPTFREEFIPDEPPEKIEAGTFIYENVAGFDGAVRYLEKLGSSLAEESRLRPESSRRRILVTAMKAVQAYERSLSLELLRVLQILGATIYGVTREAQLQERVPTFCFNLGRAQPAVVTETLARAGIGVRDGHMYSPRLMKRLGLNPGSGVVRVSLVHYNTVEEIRRFGNALSELSRNA